jgi:hypothetical protein
MKVTAFTIYRDHWLHGEGSQESFLLRSGDEKMCCIGFYGRACGVSRDELLGMKSPDDLCHLPNEMKWLNRRRPFNALVRINDSPADDSLREQKIAFIFATRGIRVIFTDEPMETIQGR